MYRPMAALATAVMAAGLSAAQSLKRKMSTLSISGFRDGTPPRYTLGKDRRLKVGSCVGGERRISLVGRMTNWQRTRFIRELRKLNPRSQRDDALVCHLAEKWLKRSHGPCVADV